MQIDNIDEENKTRDNVNMSSCLTFLSETFSHLLKCSNVA